MTNFSAQIQAILDTSKIPSQLNKVSKDYQLTIKTFALDTSGLPSQIQASLDKHKFTIYLDNIKTSNIDSNINAVGNKVGAGLASRIQAQIDNGGFQAAIDKISLSFEKLKNTGHQSLQDVKSNISSLNDLLLEMDSASDNTELVFTWGKFNDVLTTTRNTLTSIRSQSGEIVSTLQVSNLDQQMASWMEQNSAATKDFGSKIVELRSKLDELSTTGNVLKSDYDKVANAFKNVKIQAQAAGKTGKTFGDSLKNAFASISRYVSASSIVYQIVNALRKMYQIILDIDSGMTELKKVTNDTDKAYDRFLNRASKRAKELGVTIKDIVNSTADFARLGFSIDEATKLAEVANIYYAVGDGLNNIDEATQSIISTMTAFNIDANQSISIVDKFNNVSNKFAISSGGIGDALQRSASALAAANNTLDQSIALIASANTTVQDADVVGTAIKTMSARIRNATVELQESSLDMDGMCESTAKLRSNILALSGVDIMMPDGTTFKSTYDILKELSNVWSELDETSQAALTTMIAGVRQTNVFTALMANFGIAEEALAASQNSAGSAMEEHAKKMESMSAKINQFTASFEELAKVILDSDSMKVLIDSGTTLITVISKIIDFLGVIPTILIALAPKSVDKAKCCLLYGIKMSTDYLLLLDIIVFCNH